MDSATVWGDGDSDGFGRRQPCQEAKKDHHDWQQIANHFVSIRYQHTAFKTGGQRRGSRGGSLATRDRMSSLKARKASSIPEASPNDRERGDVPSCGKCPCSLSVFTWYSGSDMKRLESSACR